jgi:glucose-1-phosphate thymidylyltransferase
VTGLSGIILAAGRGSRLGELGEHYAKPALPVGDRPLIHRHVQLMRDAGVERLLVVVGHQRTGLQEALSGASKGIPVEFIVQDEPAGIAHALALAEPQVPGACLVSLGDIWFAFEGPVSALSDPVRDGEFAAMLASRQETDAARVRRNFSIETDARGRVMRVEEKPVAPRSHLKGCGVYAFGPEIFDAIRATPVSSLRNERELTDAIQVLIDRGEAVGHAPIVRDDINLTTARDLLELNLDWLRRRQLWDYVAETARLAPGAEIENSVIGAGAAVLGPIRIRNSLVLPVSTVSADRDLDRMLVYPEGVIACP